MSEPKAPPEFEREHDEESDRHLKWFSRFVRRWPNFRKHAAIGDLAVAVAVADRMGVDVEGWIAELRRREPKIVAVEPPPRSRS